MHKCTKTSAVGPLGNEDTAKGVGHNSKLHYYVRLYITCMHCFGMVWWI